MSSWQWVAVALTAGLNALDGIDVLSISYAAPGIAREWNVTSAMLGWILSMELLGMALGSIVLGGVADKVGRRTMILACLVVMAVGMMASGQAATVRELLSWRLLTGLGIGGMLPAINAAAAEFANNRWRNLAMSLMVIGYPIGGAIGGLVVQKILVHGTEWRSIFRLGSIATTSFIPLICFFVPETPAFLDRRRPHDALKKLNLALAKLGHGPVNQLSEQPPRNRVSVLDIFSPELIATTVWMVTAYFAHITSFYFIIKWTPKIIVSMGFEPSAAASLLAFANMGGALGGAMFGLFAIRYGLKLLTILVLAASSILIIRFGLTMQNFADLKIQMLLTGFCANAAIAGLYLMFAHVFPTHVRATGTGFAIGAGRGGAALAPVLAGYLFQSGISLGWVAGIMGSGSLMAALCLLFIGRTQST